MVLGTVHGDPISSPLATRASSTSQKIPLLLPGCIGASAPLTDVLAHNCLTSFLCEFFLHLVQDILHRPILKILL